MLCHMYLKSHMLYVLCCVTCILNHICRRKTSTSSPLTSPVASPRTRGPAKGIADVQQTIGLTPPPSPGGTMSWRNRLHSLRNNFLGTPRFHRKKPEGFLFLTCCHCTCCFC